MPAEATSFVGRRHELAEATKKLTAARLVSLVGPGGVGKTRLAIRIASTLGRGFPGGAWMAELAELQDPALLSNVVVAALDLRDQAGAGGPRDRDQPGAALGGWRARAAHPAARTALTERRRAARPAAPERG